jgi:hypothetical protein
MIRVLCASPADDRFTRRLHGVLFSVAMLSIFLGNNDARAANLTSPDIRVAHAVHKFEDTWQFGAIYKLRPPRRLRARYLELAVGLLSSPAQSRPFVSLGPVWQLQTPTQALFLEFGFSTTLLAGSTLAGRDLGGNLHFTSSVAVGVRFGAAREHALALRVQHTSNGGLNSTNPGLDAVALNFSIGMPTR